MTLSRAIDPSLAGNALFRENINQEGPSSSLGGDYQSLAGIPTLSTPFQLIIPRAIYDEMIAQARSELPNECCGILAGRIRQPECENQDSEEGVPGLLIGEVVHCHRLVNAAQSPTEYLSDPRSMFEAVRHMRQEGVDILAVYHSHPTSAPIPSRTDLARNYSWDVMNLIISLQNGDPQIRAWWLSEKDYREADWRVSD
jgi:proteasome lid subunit RPN8/RPN11